jgi:adenosyl cobinamide kinase/adenosyl cobinamide phosphate guanylyltransferase
MGMTLITGGARSGKSALAVRIASAWDGAVTLVATAEARDEEMEAKIARHRADRPTSWRVVEETVDVAGAVGSAPEVDLVILDCLTLWVSNLLERGVPADEIPSLASAASSIGSARSSPVIVVTNEVGDGIVPMEAESRAYRDCMGFVNSVFGREADRVLLVVAGRPVALGDPQEVIADVLGLAR